MNYRFVIAPLLLTLAFLSISCSEKKLPDGMPSLHPCTIKVTQEGTPLPEAEIQLIAKDTATARWAVTGRTDKNGLAAIFTMGKYQGAPLGEYTVLIIKQEIVYDHPPKEVNGELEYGPSTAFSLISPEQGIAEKSPHHLSIESKKNHFEFDCGKKVRIKRAKDVI